MLKRDKKRALIFVLERQTTVWFFMDENQMWVRLLVLLVNVSWRLQGVCQKLSTSLLLAQLRATGGSDVQTPWHSIHMQTLVLWLCAAGFLSSWSGAWRYIWHQTVVWCREIDMSIDPGGGTGYSQSQMIYFLFSLLYFVCLWKCSASMISWLCSWILSFHLLWYRRTWLCLRLWWGYCQPVDFSQNWWASFSFCVPP